MKQGTLFEAFSKNSTISGKSKQLKSSGSVLQTAELDGSLMSNDKSNNVSLSSILAQSGLELGVNLSSNTVTNKTEGLNLPISRRKLEEINIKGETKESKLSLMPSSQTNRKRISRTGTKQSPNVNQADKSSINQEIPLNSLKPESDKNVCVGSSDAENSSNVVENKIIDSMEYEEFITQLAYQDKQQNQCITQTIQSNEVNPIDQSKKHTMSYQCITQTIQSNEINPNDHLKKHTMSYSEFLKMFKSPPKDDDFKPADGEHEVEEISLPVKDFQNEVKCKSIASFFTKIEGNSREIKTSSSVTVTTVAEIHSPSMPKEECKKIRSPSLKKLQGKTEAVCHISPDKNEIEFIHSETIIDKAVVGKKSLATKKRNNETAVPLCQISKKQKLASQPEVHEKQDKETSGMSKILKPETCKFSEKEKIKVQSEISVKQKVKIQSDVSDKHCEASLEVSEKYKVPQSEVSNTQKFTKCGKEIVNEAYTERTDTEEIKPPSPVVITTASVMKSSQSTLCFGKSGLSLVKVIEPKKDTTVDEESFLDAQNSIKELSKNRSARRGKTINESNEQESSHKVIIIAEDEYKEQHDQHKREHLAASDSLVLATEAHLPTHKNTKEAPEADTENVQSCVLRRSARLTQSVHALKDLTVVEIDSESEEEESESKKRSKKGGKPQTFAGSEKCSGSSSKKPSGKLAPIFTSVKSKEQAGRIIPQPADPERDRLRREFLMSGIPEELKRQIATTTNANVLLDYPPFPRISHVQQILDSTSLCAKINIPRLHCAFGNGVYESTSLIWQNLGWHFSENNNKFHRNFLESFTTHPPLQHSQLDLLLKELQCSDGKFPFRSTYAYLHSKIDSVEASDCGSQVVTVEDDDDVVVIDSSPVPERLVSEQRASLWSELHQPESSEHIIGNTKAIKQLKSWLEEWKVLVEKQVRKASKISNSASKNKNSGGWSDDSDFTDSEDEEMTLCNTVLISGPHGVGKTSSVYALAKELGYKIFEVNSSSLRSGKQLLAQLEEATQSHRVAQSNTKSSLNMDNTTSGTFNSKKETGKGTKSNPGSSINQAFANLFPMAASGTQNTKSHQSQSGTKIKENKLKCPVQESSNRSGNSKKKSVQPTELKITESAPAKRDKRKKDLVTKEEISTEKIKKHKGKNETCAAVAKNQKGHQQQTSLLEVTSETSGSLNLTSASLILFDEVDVVFEEDKGFLATVQHFMMSTKIPIVMTSTDVTFHHQLQARHDHIRLQQPPLISAASFLSTLCLAHGMRISHESVLNALNYTKGDIRRCLLYLQYWCESGGGLVQVAKEVDSKSLSDSDQINNSGDVAEKLMDFDSVKTFGSRMLHSDDSDFISLKPPKKKARRMISDDDMSNDSVFTSENSYKLSTTKSTSLQNELSLEGKKSKQMKVMMNGTENVTVEVELKKQDSNLPPIHARFEETLLGLHDCDLSATTILDFVQASTLSCLGLDHAVRACSTISHTLNIDAIYHIVLHGLPLPKSGILMTQNILHTKHETPAPEIACTKSRKRIIQGDWLDSDSSNESLNQVTNPTQDATKNDDSCHESAVHETCVSVKAGSEKELSEECTVNSRMYDTESGSKNSTSKLMTSILSDITRFYDNMSFIDCLESWPSHMRSGVKLIPGLSDEEKHSKLSYNNHGDELLHHIVGPVKVLSARKFCNSIKEHVKSIKRQNGDHNNCKDTWNPSSCAESGVQPDMCDQTGWSEELYLPVQKTLPDLWSISDKVQSQSLSNEPTYKNVCKCLGPTVMVSNPSLRLDYVPYLREICRTEDERRLAKNQRRFHHYLDNIGFGLKESTIASLTSMFAVSHASQKL